MRGCTRPESGQPGAGISIGARKGHVPGAVNLPNGRWQTATGLSRDKLNILYCYSQTCHLAAEAAVELTSRGYPVVEMEDGFEGWKASGYAIENGQATPAAQAR
jgi:rhodanese-related sulfurtransferase